MVSSSPMALPDPDDSVSITVCVPVYNVERYLQECLDSILHQDYSNFNVVIVDDGSTDASGSICDYYASRYPQRTCVVHKNNEGPLLARHTGFARATGDYVMCIDSDDMLLPGSLAAVNDAVMRTGADVVRFGFCRNYNSAEKISAVGPLEYYGPSQKAEILRRLCCSTDGSQNPMWLKAVRRNCIGAEKDFSKYKGLTFAEDFLQTLVVYDQAQSFCYLDASLYYYREGSGITRSYKSHFYSDVCRCLDVAETYAEGWEREYSVHGLLSGLAACRMDSAAQYAEWLASAGDNVALDRLRDSNDFARCFDLALKSGLLRADRRLVLSALRRSRYGAVKAVAKLKGLNARIRPRQ